MIVKDIKGLAADMNSYQIGNLRAGTMYRIEVRTVSEDRKHIGSLPAFIEVKTLERS